MCSDLNSEIIIFNVLCSGLYEDQESAESAGLSLAETIASKSPVAVQGSKVNLVYARDNTVENSLDYAVSVCECDPFSCTYNYTLILLFSNHFWKCPPIFILPGAQDNVPPPPHTHTYIYIHYS